MANLNKQDRSSNFAATKPETPVESGLWFNWIRWNTNKDEIPQQDNNTRSSVDTVSTYNKRTEKVSDENEKTVLRLYSINPAVDSRTAKTTVTYPVGKEIMPPLRDNWSQGYDKMNGDLEQLKKPNAQDQWMINDEWSDPKWKFESKPKNTVLSEDVYTWVDRKELTKERNSNCSETDCGATIVDDIATLSDQKTKNSDLKKAVNVILELKNDNFIMAEELAIMKDKHHAMEQKIKAAAQNQHAKYDRIAEQYNDRDKLDHWNKEDIYLKKELWFLRENFYILEQKIKSMDEMLIDQNIKLKNITDKFQVCEEVSISSSNRNSESDAMYKKASSRIEKLEKAVDALKTEKQYFVQANRKMSKEINYIRKRSANKMVFKNFRNQIMKNLNDVKRFLNSNENINKSETEINARRKYDKLKTRLSMVEMTQATNQINTQQIIQNMMLLSATRGGVTEPMTNVHNDKKYQQKYSPPSWTPTTSSLQSASSSISSPPPLPKAGPSPKYPAYSINNDMLKSMAQELRKPDGNNIRKIPRRVDMKIPNKCTNDDEKEVALQSPEPLHQESSTVPPVPPHQEPFVVPPAPPAPLPLE